jgi:hypothetical protein
MDLKIIIMIAILTIPTTTALSMKVFYPVEDAYTTDGSKAGVNFNNANLIVGNDQNTGKHRSYLKFDLSPLAGKTIYNATFSIYPLFPVNSPLVNLYYVSNDGWKESTLNWNNAPGFNSTVVDSKTISVGSRALFNVNSLINESDNKLSIALVSADENTQNKYANFYSKDLNTAGNSGSEFYWPYIEVNYDNGSGGTCPSADYSNVCCALTSVQMMNLINKFNQFQTGYTPVQMMNFINKFNQFQPLC